MSGILTVMRHTISQTESFLIADNVSNLLNCTCSSRLYVIVVLHGFKFVPWVTFFLKDQNVECCQTWTQGNFDLYPALNDLMKMLTNSRWMLTPRRQNKSKPCQQQQSVFAYIITPSCTAITSSLSNNIKHLCATPHVLSERPSPITISIFNHIYHII